MLESDRSSSTQANSKTHYSMPDESYAQSLRAIGQALDTLRINAFTLEKEGDKYIVRGWEPSVLKNIADEVWGSGVSDQKLFTNNESSELLVYDSSDANRLEAQGRARRGSKNVQNTYTVSSGLRVVGDYLDKKMAVTFDISWSIESVKVRYKTAAGAPKGMDFTVQNLHDLGVGMYLRRSSGHLVK